MNIDMSGESAIQGAVDEYFIDWTASVFGFGYWDGAQYQHRGEWTSGSADGAIITFKTLPGRKRCLEFVAYDGDAAVASIDDMRPDGWRLQRAGENDLYYPTLNKAKDACRVWILSSRASV